MQYSSIFFCLIASVAAHGAMVKVVGNADPTSVGQAMGIVQSTPRDGSRRNPFQSDTSIIRDREVAENGVCGRTIQGGKNDVAAEMLAARASGQVAKVTSNGGSITAVVHQINGDGAGPYRCEFSADGTTFQQMTVTTNVPGQNSRSDTTATDFPLVAQMPIGVQPGTMGMVRCRNSAPAGPFGGCAPVMVL